MGVIVVDIGDIGGHGNIRGDIEGHRSRPRENRREHKGRNRDIGYLGRNRGQRDIGGDIGTHRRGYAHQAKGSTKIKAQHSCRVIPIQLNSYTSDEPEC